MSNLLSISCTNILNWLYYYCRELAKILSFIHKHPALAYYRSNFSEFDTAFSTVGTIGATFIKLKLHPAAYD